jgi:hypothetical protein
MSTKLSCLLLSFFILMGSLFAQGVDPGTENLTHKWTFDSETTGDTIAIDSVAGANGILKGGAEIFEGSLYTTFPEQWMEMPADQIAINEYNEITCSIWFYSVEDANTDYTMLVYFGDSLSNGLGINYFSMTPARGDNMSRAAIGCGDDTASTSPWNYETQANGVEYDDGRLHHMVSTLTNDSIALYIDGILSEITPLDTNNNISKIGTTMAYLSNSGYSGDATWMGEILEFSIYNKALSSEEVVFLTIQGGITPSSIDKKITNMPGKYRLQQNYPNPFNPSTTISFSIPIKSFVSLKVYDLSGRVVATIVNDELPTGDYTRQWNPTNISSGVYFYRLHAGNVTITKKLVFIR